MKKLLVIFLSVVLTVSMFGCEKDDNQNHKKSGGKKPTPDGIVDDIDSKKDPDKDPNKNPNKDELLKLFDRYYVEEDQLKWEYTEASKTLVISGEGPMRDYFDTEPEWIKYQDIAERVVIGDEVTSVGNSAFYAFSALREVSLGRAVACVDSSAFFKCYELRTVNFPEGLKLVGDYAFCNTLLHSDHGFKLPEGLLYVGKSAFFSAFKESFVALPASLVWIEESAFDNCFVEEFRVAEENPAYAAKDGVLYSKDMDILMNYPADKKDTVFEIPDTVTTIRTNAIQVANTLAKIVIPKSVRMISDAAIYWNYGLKEFVVAEDNESYTAIDGVLFTKDGKHLICYPAASERTVYSVPDGTKSIDVYAFSSASLLQEVFLNDDVSEIGSYAFDNCFSLSEITVSNSLKKVAEYAFGNCGSLTKVHYCGTPEDFQTVQIENGNSCFTDNVYFYMTLR